MPLRLQQERAGDLSSNETLGLDLPFAVLVAGEGPAQIEDEFRTAVRNNSLNIVWCAGLRRIDFQHPVALDKSAGRGVRFDLPILHVAWLNQPSVLEPLGGCFKYTRALGG
jgi:hypothetical protein